MSSASGLWPRSKALLASASLLLGLLLLSSSILPFQPLFASDDGKNEPPIARAGPNQTVEEGSPVILDGSGSRDRDRDALSYAWVQLKGKPVELSDPASVSPTFSAPSVKEQVSLLFQLTVSDGYESSSDTVRITVISSESADSYGDQENRPPVANAGEDLTVGSGQPHVTLNGSSSFDPDGDTLSYLWTQTDGPVVEVEDPNAMVTRFPLPADRNVTLTFELSVSDGSQDGSSTDLIIITILADQESSDDQIDLTGNDQASGTSSANSAENALVAEDVATAEVRGTAYQDNDFDGLRDDSEPGLEGVGIRLFGSGSIEHLIDLDDDPGPFVVHPETGKIYMIPHRRSVPTDESLSILNPTDQDHVTRIPIGETTRSAIAINPASNLVYVSSERANRIFVIDATGDELVEKVRIKRPVAIEVDEESNLIYVLSRPDSDDPSVLVLNGTTNEIQRTISASSDVASIALDKNSDTLYLVETGGFQSTVIAFELATGKSEEVTVDGILAQGFRINPDTHMIYGIATNATDVNERFLVAIQSGVEPSINATVQLQNVASELDVLPKYDLVFLVGQAGLTVIDGTSATIVGTVLTPERSSFIDIDPNSGRVYVASSGNPQDDPPIPSIGVLNDAVIRRALTASDGSFSFTALERGSYILTEVIPPGLVLSQPSNQSYILELAEGDVFVNMDFGNAPEEKLGSLTVRAADASGTSLTGIPIQVISDSAEPRLGRTPVTFSLPPGEYTVVANDTGSTFFSEWSDGFTGRARSVAIVSGEELQLGALYAKINSTEAVTVRVIATLPDGRPLDGVVKTMIFTDNNIRNILNRGVTPKDYQLTEGDVYHIFAINSGNFVFSHWFDPVTGNETSRELQFTASEGLTLNSVYEQSNSTIVTIPIKSKLTDGTELTGMFNKIEGIRFNETGHESLLDQGFTPNEYQVEKDGSYAVSAGDFDGYVIDHWEATGGPNAKRIVFSDKYSFSPRFDDNAVDSLTAVYRIVPDEKFASVPVENLTARVDTFDSEIVVEFAEIHNTGNLTAAETDILSDFDLFDGVTTVQGNTSSARATLNATVLGGDLSEENRYSTLGPVLRINDAYLTVEGETEVTLSYDPAKILGSPRILHFDGTGWQDVTTGVDTVANTVTGKLTTLSPITVGEEIDAGGGSPDELGYSTSVKRGDSVLSPSLGRSGDILLEFESIDSNGTLNVRPKPIDDDAVLSELIESGYITPDSKFGIGGVKILVESDINSAIGTLFDIRTRFDYSGFIEVTIPYDTDLLPKNMSESEIVFLHHTGSKWEQVHATVDPAKNTITALLRSLSPVVAAITLESESPPPSGGGGGSAKAASPLQPNVPESPASSVYLQGGYNISSQIVFEESQNGKLEFSLQEVLSPGNITVTRLNSSELVHLFDGSISMQSVTLEGTNFTAVESTYNVTVGSSLVTSGTVEFTVPYNMSTNGSLEGVSESDVRLIYYNGSLWHDSTVSLNTTADTVTGRMQYLGSPFLLTAAIVHDKTYGPAYFEENPLARTSIESVELLVDSSLCEETPSGQYDCPVGLAGEFRNAQRANQSYVIIIQTTDESGVAQSIELREGSIEKAHSLKINMTWSIAHTETSPRYHVKILVLDSLLGVNMIAQPRELDFDFQK